MQILFHRVTEFVGVVSYLHYHPLLLGTRSFTSRWFGRGFMADTRPCLFAGPGMVHSKSSKYRQTVVEWTCIMSLTDKMGVLIPYVYIIL
jgi:hypothetical protein